MYDDNVHKQVFNDVFSVNSLVIDIAVLIVVAYPASSD